MRALRELLIDMLSVEDARIFVADHCPEVEAVVRWREGRRDVMHQLVDELGRRGLVTDAFFDALMAFRPGRTQDIEAVRAQWRETGPAGRLGPTNIPPRGDRPFVGRDDELAQVAELLDGRNRLVVIAGQSGVGKSELALRYAENYAERYPGGRYRVHLFSKVAPPELAQLGYARLGIKAGDAGSLEGDCVATLAQLGASERTLLIYDNVPDVGAAEPWLPPGYLCDCVVTSTSRDWPHLRTVTVAPLDDDIAGELLTAFKVPADEIEVRDFIIEHGGGLPAHLCPEALAVVKRIEMNLVPRPAPLSGTAAASLDIVWELLSDDAKLFMRIAAWFEPRSIPEASVRALLVGEGWTDERVDDALAGGFDRHLLEQGPLMHDLVAKYVRSLDGPAYPEKIMDTYVEEIMASAQIYLDSPNVKSAMQFGSYPWRDAEWMLEVFSFGRDATIVAEALREAGRFEESLILALAIVNSTEQWEAEIFRLRQIENCIGMSYGMLGHWDQAVYWHRRAARHVEQEAAAGRIDNHVATVLLHHMGTCNQALGRHEEAILWFERAVLQLGKDDLCRSTDYSLRGSVFHSIAFSYALLGRHDEAINGFQCAIEQYEKGDVERRVDYTELGKCYSLIGRSHELLGRYHEAIEWYQRAIEHSEKGDKHGRVDHNSLGAILQNLGRCCSRFDQYDEAHGWYQRAIEHYEKGDQYGRVDHDSLGQIIGIVGVDYFFLQRPDEALLWLQRAISFAEQGNIHGRVDYSLLASMLEMLARIRHQLGDQAAAEEATRRAAEERAKLK